MGSVTLVFRFLAAVLVGAGAILGAAPALATAGDPAAVAAAVAVRAETERVIFTGRFVRSPSIKIDGAVPVRRYQVAVDQVFGEGSITTQRVTVRATIPLESCGTTKPEQATPGESSTTLQPSAPTSSADPEAPTTIDKQLRVFTATRDGAGYVVPACKDVTVVDDTVLATLVEQYGEGRDPGAVEQPTTPLDAVGYLCPDTRETVDLGGRSSCAALQGGQSFDRAAAPGLALVIVGVLGLLVARRMGRRRA